MRVCVGGGLGDATAPAWSLWGTDGASSSADAVKLRRSASGVDIGRLLLRRRAKDL